MSILGITEKYSFITYGKKIILLVLYGDIFLFFKNCMSLLKTLTLRSDGSVSRASTQSCNCDARR